HSLMGENGAGKSTLIKALTGVYQIDSGAITVAGERKHFAGTSDAERAGIATVYQEVNLCANLSIGENVMLGHEVRGRFGVNWKQTNRVAVETLSRLGLQGLDPTKPLASLSLAVQQLVAIARAMVIEPRVLVLDEPTSSLDANEVESLFIILRRLRDEGVAILFVSHFLEQVYAISDRLTVLRDGRFVGEYPADLPQSVLISKMIGKELEAFRSLDTAAQKSATHRHDATVLAAEGLGRKGAIMPTDISLQRGAIVGLAGLLGSGRTELARLLYGADKADSGTVTLRGKKTALSSPVTALEHRIAFSTENRGREGIIGDLTVRENLVLAVQAKRGWMRPMPRKEQDRIVAKYINELGVRPADPERLIKNLSGGNQQKVLLGRWLATNPEILILDEPTRGIDIGAKADIQETILNLAEDGVAILFISSELDEVVRICERILVLKDRNKIAEIENGPDVTSQTIVGLIADHGADLKEVVS
ncbi:sugar ABC transporter ATP-binding protein, partial [Georgenia sp. MJ170]|uniref:sugar ABC transporter ATP-binding protein n=1 Tax=Georgenia sunbinii TaxID=3117728 RepID=UPI002F261A18